MTVQSLTTRSFRAHHRFLGLTVVLSLALVGCGDSQPQEGQQPPPPPVTITTVETGSIDVREDYAGRVRGARDVAVNARVDGILLERRYQEGRSVSQGDVLFLIDPEPYEVALQASRAERETARADLNQAEREWRRISRLYDQNAVSERERDVAQSALELSRAGLAVAEAGVRRAELELSYTRVEAPLSGVTGLETLPEGSLIASGTELTRIVELDPVHIRFALPEDDATVQRRARRAMAEGDDGDSEGHQLEGRVMLADGREFEQPARIDFTASTIDPRTGTVSVRAVVANPDRDLVPGQFVRVNVVLETLEDVILIPESSVMHGPMGLMTWVLDDEDKARIRPVTSARVIDGMHVIQSGLETGDRLVINGMLSLEEGAEVSVQEKAEEASEETEAAPQDGSGPDEDAAGEEG